MIKKIVFAVMMIATVSGVTSCVSNDYEDDFERGQKISDISNKNTADTISITPINPADASISTADDGDREKWGNTKID